MTHPKSLETIRDELFMLINEQKVSFFCGAGISRDSKIFVVEDINKKILGGLCIEGKDRDPSIFENIPFEAVIETISGVLPIESILNLYRKGTPNIIHKFMAGLMEKNLIDTIATTNFDTLIENSFNKKFKTKVLYSERHFGRINNYCPSIIKLHGTITDEKSIRTTIKSIAQRKLYIKRRNAIKYIFSTGRHDIVLILGYSCSDLFDITPLVNIISRASNKRIMMICHITNPVNPEVVSFEKTDTTSDIIKRLNEIGLLPEFCMIK